MFFNTCADNYKHKYTNLIKAISLLSNLFSDSKSPYIHYRTAERVFCKAFCAVDLSRNDISIDAKIQNMGFALKTFLYRNGNSLQKIAEFNRDYVNYQNLNNESLVAYIANLRNNRLISSCKIAGVDIDNIIYHMLVRDINKVFINETKINLINSKNINIVDSKKGSIVFYDGVNEYFFNKSKSTLFQRFHIDKINEIHIAITEDPFIIIEKLSMDYRYANNNNIKDSIILPLYSIKNGQRIVFSKSGLNQWNAGGRKRNANEIYIPIPSYIHKQNPDFFPSKDTSFNLKLPNSQTLKVKLCQDNNKALMSDPNMKLGIWLLRDILNIQERELVTYKHLLDSGINSVQINKYEDNTYDITFKNIKSES